MRLEINQSRSETKNEKENDEQTFSVTEHMPYRAPSNVSLCIENGFHERKGKKMNERRFGCEHFPQSYNSAF